MGNYAVIVNGICTNVVVVDDHDWAMDQGLVLLDGLEPMPWIDWHYDGNQWYPPGELPDFPTPFLMEIIGPVVEDVQGGMPGRIHVIVEHEGEQYALPLIPIGEENR